MDEGRQLEDFTEEEIQELEKAEGQGDKLLTVDSIMGFMNFTAEELAEIKADADEAYAELEKEEGQQ